MHAIWGAVMNINMQFRTLLAEFVGYIDKQSAQG